MNNVQPCCPSCASFVLPPDTVNSYHFSELSDQVRWIAENSIRSLFVNNLKTIDESPAHEGINTLKYTDKLLALGEDSGEVDRTF